MRRVWTITAIILSLVLFGCAPSFPKPKGSKDTKGSWSFSGVVKTNAGFERVKVQTNSKSVCLYLLKYAKLAKSYGHVETISNCQRKLKPESKENE
jgi:hypothetical protein